MTHDPSHRPRERLEALLDGRLSPAETAQAQREFATETRLQESINSTLRQRFAPPSPDRLLALVRAADKAPAPLKLRSGDARRWLLVAACILVLIGSGWWLAKTGHIPGLGADQRFVINPRRNPPFDGPSTIEAHNSLVAAGFKPKFETSDPLAIAAAVWRRTGQGLEPSNLPGGARILGLSETPCLSASSLVLLMKVNDRPVSLIIDKLDNDRLLCVSAPMEITPFRRVVGDVVIYEVTPHGKPLIYDCFIEPKRTREQYEADDGF